MKIVCYHNGALGHAVAALIESCTKEGSKEFPSFVHGNHLHHYKPENILFQIRHPECDVEHEKTLGNVVLSSSSNSYFGRFLILLMGLKKWTRDEPGFNHVITYKQYGETYGDQLEILSLTLRDKVKSDLGWFLDADYVLDIVDFWKNSENVINWLERSGFDPDKDRVLEFCTLVSKSNQEYYDIISKCVSIVDDVEQRKIYNVDLNFYEVAMCHAMLLIRTNSNHIDIKLLRGPPDSTQNFIEIFYG